MGMSKKEISAGRWVESRPLCEIVGFSYTTLHRLKGEGYWTEGRHYRRKNPTRPKSELLWNVDRVFLKLGIAL
ncbi:hypothetical protein [Synechococcus sp. SYN20]|uniref:hypothetical protein n=1 Tax=Synechococcus sp. SYN20 TaxID=1050714 RepID=UPI001CA3F6F2|nr:hypothetical protein [Synechococcus sp. SYN20]